MLLSLIDFLLTPFHKKFFNKIKRNSAVKKTIDLYGSNKFTRIRFWDAPFLEVERLVPKKGTILDLGCGEGIFTNFLAVSSKERKITGIEIDRKRVSEASRGVKNVNFIYGDITEVKIPEVDVIILFHVLHHLKSFNSQENLIKECIKRLKSRGKLIIIEVKPELSIQYLIAYFTDHFLVPWLFEKKFYSPIFFRSKHKWLKLFKKFNLSCKIIPMEKGKPFSHVIFYCEKV